MKAAAIVGPGRVEIVEREAPTSFGDLVVVMIMVAPMCTENRRRRTGDPTDVLGHEAAGVVVDAGRSTRVREGDRVVVMPGNACGKCRDCVAGEHIFCPFQRNILAESRQSYGVATYAQYILKPDWLLLAVPDDISLSRAAAACCLLGPTLNACERMSVSSDDTLLVSGCGPVGLGGIINGLSRGARVLALEVNPYRAALATELGAQVFDPTLPGDAQTIKETDSGWGVSSSIETSGIPGSPSLLAGFSAHRARLAIVAWDVPVSLPPLPPLGLEVYGCWHWNHQSMGETMFDLIRAAEPLVDKATTHQLLLEEVSIGMDLQDAGACGKVQLFPNGIFEE
jgi:L-iditol 2-dehydrogenase